MGYDVFKVTDEVPNCRTELMKKCRPVTEGYVTKEVCDEWPVQRCDVEARNVSKVTPDTKCWKEPREVCGPVGCGVKNVSSGMYYCSSH